MIPVRHDAVEVDFDGQRAGLRGSGTDVFDDRDLGKSLSQGLGLPMIGSNAAISGTPPVRAKVSFDVEWDGALATAQIENHTQRFKGAFLSTGATISWTAEQPGFQFQSDTPSDPKANILSLLGA